MPAKPTPPFRCDADDDPDIALEIERDAARCGAGATLARYLAAVPGIAARPIALDTAIECALRAIGGDSLAAAQRLIVEHPDLADPILACALGLGLAGAAPSELAVDALLYGRWRVLETVGSGATAQVARVRDEALSTPDTPVDAIVKRFDESLASEARAHALREMRALLAAPPGLAPRPLALHASDTGACVLITRHEASRPATSTDDFARALDAVSALHRAGIAHADLKPEHLRVRADGSVFLIDFGSACTATDATTHADLARLAAMAHAASRGWLDRIIAEVAVDASVRGPAAIVRTAIHAASRRRRRRVLAQGLALTGAAGALVVSGLAFGRWLTAPPRIATEPFGVVDALARTGRLREARIGPDGRITGFVLSMPELRDAPGVVFRDGRSEFSTIRFMPEGGIVATPDPEFVKSLSQHRLHGH